MEGKVKYIAKAMLGRKNRIKSAVIIALVALAVCSGIVLMVYSLIKGSILFGIGYMLASVLGIGYILIAINSIFSAYVAADKNKLYIKSWVNGFVPYDLHFKMNLIKEFIPSKTLIVQINVSNIQRCVLGSLNYCKRYCMDNYEFVEKIRKFEKLEGVNKTALRHMDLLYVETNSGESCFMPVTGFDTDSLARILNHIEKNSGAEIRCNNKDIVRMKKIMAL